MFNEITNGANDMEKRCREAQAATAFLWFAWAGYTASMIVDLIQVRQHTSSFQGRRTGRQRPSPMMTQV